MTKQSSKQKLSQNQSAKKTQITLAIAAALALPTANAATFNVTEPNDDGTGLVANTLSWAILQANTTNGADTIELNTDVTITGVMKRLIDSDTTLQSDATRRTIDGNNQFRPLFIKSGQVTIQNLDIENGRAEGGSSGSSGSGGSGAGLGGGIFVYTGSVSLDGLLINKSIAVGGGTAGFSMRGGGGMYGSASRGGGGLFDVAPSGTNLGAYGGYGEYQNNDPIFAKGGSFTNQFYPGESGGFGAGGGYAYYGGGGNGGFGGGGGFGYYSDGGNGGFGAGAGISAYYSYGSPGFGAEGQDSAGFGGALFIREGSVSLKNTVFSDNQAKTQGELSNMAEGYGGAIFVLHSMDNSNNNNQGMPDTLPIVTGCGVIFANNSSETDPGQANHNDDVFDIGNRIAPDDGVTLTASCGSPDQEIQVSGKGIEIIDGDVTPNLTDGTDLGDEVAGFNVSFQTYTIENSGNHPIQLTGDPMVSLTNNINNQFEISQQPVSSVIFGGQSVEFQLMFAPQDIGVDTATVVIESNDEDENPYDFQVQGNGLVAEAEIDVKGNGEEIIAGDISPDVLDDTDFGESIIGFESVTKTFTIENNGYAGLNLTGSPIVSFQNNSGQFEVTAQPVSNFVEPGLPLTFDITFTATNEGVDTATVVIENNDSDENPYDFVIQAEAVDFPDIAVFGNGIEILDGDDTPDVSDTTNFDAAIVSKQTITHSFVIHNYGPGVLNLIGDPIVDIQGNTSQFQITRQPESNIVNPNFAYSFDVEFNPIIGGVDTAILFIESNDPDETLYNFSIVAEGIPQHGIIQVFGNGIEILNNDIIPSGNDGTYFGSTPVEGGFIENHFIVKNTSAESIQITDILVNSPSETFEVLGDYSNYIVEGNSEFLISVMFDPEDAGDADLGLLEIYTSEGLVHTNGVRGFGQPTMTVSAINNYAQEGEELSFRLEVDLPISANTMVYTDIIGDVQLSDFVDYNPNEYVYFGAGQLSKEFSIETSQDGFYEGTEFFQLSISLSDPYNKFHVGFPSRVLGVIDDDLIFDDGFEAVHLNQIIAAMGKYAFDSIEVPICNDMACNFLNSSYSLEVEPIVSVNVLAWFEETLCNKRPYGDWDGDGLPNHHDLNPFGLDSMFIEKIKHQQ